MASYSKLITALSGFGTKALTAADLVTALASAEQNETKETPTVGGGVLNLFYEHEDFITAVDLEEHLMEANLGKLIFIKNTSVATNAYLKLQAGALTNWISIGANNSSALSTIYLATNTIAVATVWYNDTLNKPRYELLVIAANYTDNEPVPRS